MSDENRPDVRDVREIQVDASNLYREEVFTDLKVGTIRRLTPVRSDGSTDPDRPLLFSGETQLLTQAGLIPVHAPIEASSLEQAIAHFPEAVNRAVERLMEEARELQRREASRIVVPGSPGFGGPGMGPGGGKLDLG